MRINSLKATLNISVLVAIVLLLGSSVQVASAQVPLTAAANTLIFPDGSTVPMWGYICGAPSGTNWTCAKSNPAATGWSPVVITVPSGQTLSISLTNNLPTPPGATSGI